MAESTPEAVKKLLAGVGHIAKLRVAPEADGLVRARMQAGAGELQSVCRAVFFAFAHADVPLLELRPKKASLEEVFLELAEQPAQAAGQGGGAVWAGAAPDETKTDEEADRS